MLCRGCGNEIDPGAECGVCAAGLARRAAEREKGPITFSMPVLCTGCGNEIDPAQECPVCAERLRRRSARPSPAPTTAEPDELSVCFCTTCGNEFFGDEGCPYCASRPAPPAPRTEQDRWEEERRSKRRVLCPECGNEMEVGGECEVCAVRQCLDQEEEEEEQVTRFCVGCGNEIYGNGDCPVCDAGRAPRKQAALKLCPGCGNEVEDIHQCPICLAGRAPGKRRADEPTGPLCPQCDEALDEQEWDSEPVKSCPSCQGGFFLPGGLERILDKLRDSVASTDREALVAEFRKRLHGSLPKTVRYKPCPICRGSMTRRNYKRVSGIVIDFCGKHGTWVDQSTFGQLTEFITRGGDRYAERKKL